MVVALKAHFLVSYHQQPGNRLARSPNEISYRRKEDATERAADIKKEARRGSFNT
jgi:hypothetical protein